MRALGQGPFAGLLSWIAITTSMVAAASCGATTRSSTDPSLRTVDTVAATPPRESVEPTVERSADASPPVRPESVPELANFHARLRSLERRRAVLPTSTAVATSHVRILWVGDSHGQADFWSGRLRQRLAARFGPAGPGFLHAGYKNYRHDGVKLDIQGKWRMRPKQPVTTKHADDGIFGLGGLMMSGYADTPRVELHFTDPLPAERVAVDVCYRLREPADSLVIDPGHETRREIVATDAEPAGSVRHFTFSTSAVAPLVLMPRGRTDLCGVVVETDPTAAPGVIVDTLAINGARYGTALAWDAGAWQSEVARRVPDLVVMQLGTNEAGDGHPAYDSVGKQAEELLARVKVVAPNVDCVLVSNTDRADAEARSAKMRDSLRSAAKRAGCFWFDAWEILGGEGAMAKLREEPDPKVQPDGIHLTIKGYRGLGDTMFEQLLNGYAP